MFKIKRVLYKKKKNVQVLLLTTTYLSGFLSLFISRLLVLFIFMPKLLV